MIPYDFNRRTNTLEEIIDVIDKQISRLQSARAALVGSESTILATGIRRGRPPGALNKNLESTKPLAKRVLSDEGKAKIAAAQKARWAAAKKAAKPIAEKTTAKPLAKKTTSKSVAKKTALKKTSAKKEAAKPVEPKKESTTAD